MCKSFFTGTKKDWGVCVNAKEGLLLHNAPLRAIWRAPGKGQALRYNPPGTPEIDGF